MKEIFRIIQEWFSRDHTRLALGIGIFSAGLAGYSLGILRNMTTLESPIMMNVVSPQAVPTGDAESVAAKDVSVLVPSKVNPLVPVGSCRFVGSRNSTLYHLPTCAAAKRIKESNRVCFASEDAARAKGYAPGCLK